MLDKCQVKNFEGGYNIHAYLGTNLEPTYMSTIKSIDWRLLSFTACLCGKGGYIRYVFGYKSGADICQLSIDWKLRFTVFLGLALSSAPFCTEGIIGISGHYGWFFGTCMPNT